MVEGKDYTGMIILNSKELNGTTRAHNSHYLAIAEVKHVPPRLRIRGTEMAKVERTRHDLEYRELQFTEGNEYHALGFWVKPEMTNRDIIRVLMNSHEQLQQLRREHRIDDDKSYG